MFEKLEAVEKRYDELTKMISDPEVINNPAIYSLLTSKYHDSEEKGIGFNVDVFMDLRTLNMKEYEFTRILGILLDNAIEAIIQQFIFYNCLKNERLSA